VSVNVAITPGKISVVRFMHAVDGHAPDDQKQLFNMLLREKNSALFVTASKETRVKLKLPEFTADDVAWVRPLTPNQREFCLFYGDVDDKRKDLSERIDTLISWGAWDTLARLAELATPPFTFGAEDIRNLFDPTGAGPTVTDGQAGVRLFLNAVETDPNQAASRPLVENLIRWGAWESLSDLVAANPSIPYKFSPDDARAIIDPEGRISPRGREEAKKYIDVWAFHSNVETAAAAGDAGAAAFLDELNKRIRHGCWKSIADLVNSNDAIPYSGFDPVVVRAVLDPEGRYGVDDECACLASAGGAPIWAKPIEWAAVSVAWAARAGEDVIDWTKSAPGDIGEWTKGAVEDVGDWTKGAVSSASEWTGGAASSTAGWVSGTAATVATTATAAATAAAAATAGWVGGAASDVGDWTKGAATKVVKKINPKHWF